MVDETEFQPPAYLIQEYSYLALQSPWVRDMQARYEALTPWQKRKIRIKSRINRVREQFARPLQHIANKIRGYDYGNYDSYDD